MARKYTPQELDAIKRTDPARFLDICEARNRRRIDRGDVLIGEVGMKVVRDARDHLRQRDA